MVMMQFSPASIQSIKSISQHALSGFGISMASGNHHLLRTRLTVGH